jgi:hypothetical protein
MISLKDRPSPLAILPPMCASRLFFFLLTVPAILAEPPKRHDFAARASVIDRRAKEHPEIGFVFGNDGKPQDVQHASADTRAEPQGKLVIWLMGHNQGLFDRVSGYGLHAIQVHYANGWFGKLYGGQPPEDDLFLSRIRLEAATGEDRSEAVDIPKPDSIMGRSLQFVKWLHREHPGGRWDQFLAPGGRDLRWDKVILAGISHGSTTAARMAKHVKVDRVVMFSGPRDQFEVWQGLPSATPGERFFGFTHVLDDGWKNDHYCRSWQLLRLQEFGPVTDVDKSRAPYANSRRLVSNADVNKDPNRAHNAVIPGGGSPKDKAGKYLYEDVWRYLFTHPVDETGEAVPADPACRMEQRR